MALYAGPNSDFVFDLRIARSFLEAE
jgi:hypothetical protein